MGEINISPDEQDALAGVDAGELETLIRGAVETASASDLHRHRLTDCGPYVARRFRDFEQALAECRMAKAAERRAEADGRARRAGDRLSSAVVDMTTRMAREKQEGRLFHVEDRISMPHTFHKSLDVVVGYRWRRRVDEEWNFGSITFTHDFVERPLHGVPPPSRKPSAARRRELSQDELRATWEHLVRTSLHSVRDYFRNGGDGAVIPGTFRAKADPHSGGLNNFSADFWRQRP